jgi:hypothetical protein
VALLESRLEKTDDFARRRERMQFLVDELRQRSARVAAGGGERAVERHRARGKLLARERIDRLVDPGTAFLELNALAAWEIYGDGAPSAGIVTGIGVVEGRECVVVANDATVKGGSYFPLTSSTPAGPSCRSRPRSSPTATTSGGSSSTRPACPRRESHRSPWSWARARLAAPTCRR